MKPQHFAALAGALLLIAVVLVATAKPQTEVSKAAPPGRVVTVTGEGEVRVRPDHTQITLGIWTQGSSAADAEDRHVASVQRVREALTAAGVEEHGLEVTQSALSTTTYQDYTGSTSISGFQAQSRITGILKNVSKVQVAIDAALGAGATSLEDVVYAVENPEASKQAAMKEALENARDRADALVRAEGESLGELQSMEMLLEDSPAAAHSPGTLVFRAKVRATFGY